MTAPAAARAGDARIRIAMPNIMGSDAKTFAKATYHAFWEETKGSPKPADGRPAYPGLRAQSSNGRPAPELV